MGGARGPRRDEDIFHQVLDVGGGRRGEPGDHSRHHEVQHHADRAYAVGRDAEQPVVRCVGRHGLNEYPLEIDYSSSCTLN